MAIAMASVGGAGFLHYNMTQEEQVAHLKVVKAHRLGYVTRPEVRGPDATLAECDALATSRGFTSVVVTDTGIVGGKLLGLVSSRDGDLAMDRSTKLKDVMTKAADLVTGKASQDIDTLEDILLKSKKGKLPVVNDKGELVGLMTRASVKSKKLLPPPGAPSLDKKGRLERAVGPADRSRLDQYFTSVRELEQRLDRSIEWEHRPKPQVDYAEPQDIADAARVIEKSRLMFDLVRLAFETDSTRVVTLSLSTFAIVAAVPGVKNETHELTHHGNDPAKIAELKKLEESQLQTFGSLLTSLRGSGEQGPSLLDQTAVLYGSCLGNANSHSNRNLPIILAGGGFRHPGHLAFDADRNEPLANLFVSLLQKLGIEADSFASSTGTLRGFET